MAAGREAQAMVVPLIELPSGGQIPVYGQGTWGMAERPQRRQQEITALRLGMDLGITLIDTAEMYADGAAEELVAEAVAGRRDEAFIVSKVLPENATRRGTIAACERSLRRLKTDRIDLYLLHWRGSPALHDTCEAFATLARSGKILDWGVSNFDMADMEELGQVSGAAAVAANQVLYTLTRRGIEYDLMPYCGARKIPIMAYSPIEQGRMLGRAELKRVAARNGATPAQVALAWLLQRENVIVVAKAASPAHVRENRAALELRLTQQDLDDLDRAFPPPRGPMPLEIL